MTEHIPKILVTGGAGFIGSNFVLDLIGSRKASVINLDLLTYAGSLDTLSPVMDDPWHIFIKGDIGDRKLVKRLLQEHHPVAVINFAAESHVDRSIDGPIDFIRTNVVGTFELLDAVYDYWSGLKKVEREEFRFLHISTDEVYGSLGDSGSFIEESPYMPNSPYAASKASSDHFVRAYHRTYGLPVLTINSSNNYGPRQYPEKLIPLTIYNALHNRPIPVYGDGQHVRDWLYVKDHCKAILNTLKNGEPGTTYNVGGSSERTNLEVIYTICDLLDELSPRPLAAPHASLITFVEDRPGHDRRYAMDASKAHRELGWVPTETFESGIEKTVRWYFENQEWCDRVMQDAYRGQRLGLAKKQ